MPTIADVLPSNVTDKSCGCVLRNACAMVADAVPGQWEGRNLQCRVENEARRLVRCRFEARFVEEWQPDRPTPGEWAWQGGVFHVSPRGAWCAGTG